MHFARSEVSLQDRTEPQDASTTQKPNEELRDGVKAVMNFSQTVTLAPIATYLRTTVCRSSPSLPEETDESSPT